MTEYWKSNPKKYCDICKCWITANQISINNHESGMRHKGNVQKKLSDIRKNNKESTDGKMRKKISLINDLAHVGMIKDIERDPSLSKRYGVTMNSENFSNLKKKAQETEKQSSKKKKPDIPVSKQLTKPTIYEWKEVKTADGKIYYWNKKSGVTQWDRPLTSVESIDDSAAVQVEKQRLDQFVFNRLIELSESGSIGANEAVCQAFDAQLPSNENNNINKIDDINTKFDEQLNPSDEINNLAKEKSLKVKLLADWQPALPEPLVETKIDPLPNFKVKKPIFGQIKLRIPKHDQTDENGNSRLTEKVDLLSRLADVNESNINESIHPRFEEKKHTISFAAQKAVEIMKLESCISSSSSALLLKPESDAIPVTTSGISFKRKINNSSRNFRSRQQDY